MSFLRGTFRIATISFSLVLVSFESSAQSSFADCKAKLSAGGNLAGAFLTGGTGLTSLAGQIGGNYLGDYICSPDPDPEPPVSCQTNANSEQCQQDRKAQQQEGPPACLVQARALASTCAANHNTATTSCSDSQMPRSKQSSQQTASTLEGTENTNAACTQARQFNDTFQRELQQFAASCESAVAQCASACQQLQSVAASCPSSQARQIAAQHQSQNASCQSGGTLASRPSQARGQADEANKQLNQSAACAKESQAAQTAQNTQPSSANNPSVDTGGGAGTLGQNPNVSGDLTGLSTTPGSGPATSSLNGSPSRVDTSGANSQATDLLLPIADTSSNGWNSGNSLATLPGTPARTPSSDGEEGSKNIEQVTSALGSSGTYGGGGGKAYRPLLRPVRKVSMTAADADGEKSETKSGDEVPDLNQFRPTGMAGLVRCPLGANPTGLMSGEAVQCIHSPHKDLFQVIKESFERQVRDQKLYYDL